VITITNRRGSAENHFHGFHLLRLLLQALCTQSLHKRVGEYKGKIEPFDFFHLLFPHLRLSIKTREVHKTS